MPNTPHPGQERPGSLQDHFGNTLGSDPVASPRFGAVGDVDPWDEGKEQVRQAQVRQARASKGRHFMESSSAQPHLARREKPGLWFLPTLECVSDTKPNTHRWERPRATGTGLIQGSGTPWRGESQSGRTGKLLPIPPGAVPQQETSAQGSRASDFPTQPWEGIRNQGDSLDDSGGKKTINYMGNSSLPQVHQ